MNSDHHCILYANCTKKSCESGAPGSWWTTFEYGRPGNAAWTPCPGPGPTPPGPPAPSVPGSFDCEVRLFALAFAKRNLNGADVSSVAAALNLDVDTCSKSDDRAAFEALVTGPKSPAAVLPPLNRPPQSEAAVTFFVDGFRGSDSAAGTLEAPFKTPARAQSAVRTASPLVPRSVMLRQGTYFVGRTLQFNKSDSGSPAAPVVWSAYNNEKVVLSGGVDLTGLTWSPSQIHPTLPGEPKALAASLPAAATSAGIIRSLRVGGRREIRCKFPNGDPLIPGAVIRPPIYTGSCVAVSCFGLHRSLRITKEAKAGVQLRLVLRERIRQMDSSFHGTSTSRHRLARHFPRDRPAAIP